ncbi:F-box-like domain-containing [Fusarium acutatum]|uniref:F-box-like domain-containing n=1 Tax=Fusarium acutatum TaxID=78861 RepID=A0A8H4JNH5_9HYPO|nr:F-box-like domain-containing [Fusarium acutatum]
MTAKITALPTEVLWKVINDAGNDSRAAVISCLLVNQLWRDASLPILYRDLVLSCGQSLDRFIACHNQQALTLTQSFTLYLNHDDQSDRLDKAKWYKTELLIPQLANVIPTMGNLKSFSLIRHHRTMRNPLNPWSDAQLYKTTRSTISSLLKSLPESCISLEFAVGDTNGSNPDLDSTHLCEDLRRLLPQLQHVHINLVPVCNTILGTWDKDKVFHPISLPHLRSLHLVCIENNEWADLHQPRPLSTWHSVIHGLQQVAKLPETSSAARITVLGVLSSGGESDKSIYRTFLRCNVGKEARDTKTWAFPVTWLVGLNHTPAHYIRMRNGEGFVVLDKRDYIDIAGGRSWRTLTTGARLPTAWTCGKPLMPDHGIFQYAEWSKMYPKKQPMLIRNERLAGQCLIGVKNRQGYENTASLVEQTPEGFVRYGGPVSRNWQLYRKDEEGPEDWNPDAPNGPVD